MSDNTKTTLKWTFSKMALKEIKRVAPYKSVTPEELVDICIIKQMSEESKKLTDFEKVMWQKMGVKFDVQAICATQNVFLKGSLVEVIGSAITFSDVFLTQIDGKEQEKKYLFAIYSRIEGLRGVDKDSFVQIMKHIKKNKRKSNIYKEYLENMLA